MILDASALLAFLLREAGKDRVAEALLDEPQMTTVNFAEVVTKYVQRGARAQAETLLDRLPVVLVPVDTDLALRSAMMAGVTRPLGLSLGDRICLALGARSGLTVLTADTAWTKVADEIGVAVELIRYPSSAGAGDHGREPTFMC